MKSNKEFIKQDLRFQKACVLVLKVTNRCNISCTYCYEKIRRWGRGMSIHTFKTIVGQAIPSSIRQTMAIVLHGGEPTLMSENWLNEACEFTLALGELYKKTLFITIQSNLVSISNYHIKLAKKYHLLLSVSLDNPTPMPFVMRPKADIVIQNYYKLVDNGIFPSVLMTINHSNYRYFQDILNYLENNLKLNSFKANIVYPVGRASHLPYLLPEQIFEAQQDILEYMISCEGKIIEHNLAEEILRCLASEQERTLFPKSLHLRRPCGAGTQVFAFTPDGKILPCGRLASDERTYTLGTIFKDNGKIKRLIDRFHETIPGYVENCITCPADSFCDHGCQAFIIQTKGLDNIACLPTKLRYHFYTENQKRLIPVLKSIRERHEYKFAKQIPFEQVLN